MIEVGFSLPDAKWDSIKVVVRDALDRDADQVVLESARVDGTKHDVTLRTEIAGTASVHLARDRAMRNLPTQLALRKHLTDLREKAQRLRDGIIGSRAFWFAYNNYAPDNDMLVATDAYFEKLLRNLDGNIMALGPPRKKTGSAASKKKSRDLFWSDLLSIWCEIGGKETGADTADFLIAVSGAVFSAMPHRARDGVPERLSVIQWLRRRSPQG